MEKKARVLVTAGLAVGLLASALDQTIVDTAFPRMIVDLGGVSIFTWVITIYLLASTAVVPVVGKLADLFGRKIFYLIGMGLFLAGSALCGAAHSMVELIIFRGIQGIGGGMLTPVIFTVIGDLYPGTERAKMQGVFGGIFGLANVIGPKLGGWITLTYSWRWVFYVNLPIGLLAFAIIAVGLKESKGGRQPIDYWGALAITVGISLFLLALSQGGDRYAWDSWQILSMLGGAALVLGSLGYIERRVPEPILNFELFRNRTYAVMCAAGFLMGVGLFGVVIFVPWFIQGVVGVDPNVAGSVMTPMMIAVVVFAGLTARLSARLPYSLFVSSGFGFIAIGYLIMTGWSASTSLVNATLATLVMGAGMGCLMPVATTAVQNALPARFRGQVTSSTTFFRSVGGTVGTSVFGLIFNRGMGLRFSGSIGGLLHQAQAAATHAGPAGVHAFQTLMAQMDKPQNFVQLLLQERLRALLPEALQPQILDGIKVMMVDSLHAIFVAALVLAVAGVAVGLALGKESLPLQVRRLAEEGESPALHGGPALEH